MASVPGRSFRQGMGLVEAMKMFPDDDAAEAWFMRVRWPHGPACPECGSTNVQTGAAHRMPLRCRERQCRKRFSVRYGTVMQSSKLGYQVWAMAIYLCLTSLESVLSMKLHRDLNITRKSAWRLAHRLRKAFEGGGSIFAGPVEVDETYMGGRRANTPKSKRERLTGRGAVGKAAIVGARGRATNQARAQVVERTDRAAIHDFVAEHTDPETTVYSDEAAVRASLPNPHETVNHGSSEYVRGDVHTNGVESFWSMLKRAHKRRTFHKMSPKHLNRYVREFAAKYNLHDLDALDLMGAVVTGMDGKQLGRHALIAPNGLDSGARC